MNGDRGMRFLCLAGGVLALSGFLGPAFALPSLAGGAVALLLAPGHALAVRLAPAERPWLAVARALFLSSVLTGTAAVVLLAAGLPARAAGAVVAAAGAAAGALPVRRRAPERWPSWERRAAAWMLVLALLVLLPHALREWVRWRSDAWFHSAVAYEIAARGVPPGDPYFAGFTLNYLWFYHALAAAWSALAGVAPWNAGGLLNAAWLASLGGGVYSFSRRLGRPGREAFFAALFVPLGLEALFTLWLPLKAARAVVGETAGPAVLRNFFGLSPFGFESVFRLTSTWGSVPPFLNKFWVMSAFGGAVCAAVWVLEGVAGMVRRRTFPAGNARLAGPGDGVFLALAAFGAWVLHPASGLAVTVGLGVAGALLLAAPGGAPRRALLSVAPPFAAGVLPAGILVALSAGRAEGPFPLGFDPAAARAILVSATAAILLGVPGLAGTRRGASARLARVLAIAFGAASLVVVLPPPNTADKMAFLFHLVPAAASGWMLARLWRALRARGRFAAAIALVAFLFVPVNALYLGSLLLERAAPSPSAAEQGLYAWIRAATPPDAVFLDTAERDDVLVRGPRRQYWGREPYAGQWGYDRDLVARRRLVRDALNRAGGGEPPREAVERALEELEAFAGETGAPVYVIWRPADHDGRPAEASVMGRRPDRFRTVFVNDAATVFARPPAGEGGGRGAAEGAGTAP